MLCFQIELLFDGLSDWMCPLGSGAAVGSIYNKINCQLDEFREFYMPNMPVVHVFITQVAMYLIALSFAPTQ